MGIRTSDRAEGGCGNRADGVGRTTGGGGVTFLPADAYHMVSDPSGYTIAKFWLFGELFYESWRGKRMLATRLPSADAARTVCNGEDISPVSQRIGPSAPSAVGQLVTR